MLGFAELIGVPGKAGIQVRVFDLAPPRPPVSKTIGRTQSLTVAPKQEARLDPARLHKDSFVITPP